MLKEIVLLEQIQYQFTDGRILFSEPNPDTPVYFFALSLHMTKFGGKGVEALRNGISSISEENSPLHLPEDKYEFKVVTCTSDGAIFDLDKKTRFMMRERG